MPELPEVETTCRGISDYLVGARVVEIIVRTPKLRWPIPTKSLLQLKGEKIVSVRRRAKYIILDCESSSIIIHLGMSGQLYMVNKSRVHQKHDHLDFVLNSKWLLRYTDPRRFGSVMVSPTPEDHDRLRHLGPEPLTEEFDGEYLKSLANKRRVCVKSLLMDASVVVGVGNIYASESLYQAGVHPSRQANKISLQRYDKLVVAVKRVLTKAIAAGGTTLKDFVNGEGKPGYFQQSLNVYGRAAEPCFQCGTLIKSVVISQRTTYYCPKCQR